MDKDLIYQGQQWLESLLKLLGVPTTVGINQSEMAQDSGSYWLTIQDSELTSGQIEQLTGEQGEVLDAIQYFANTTLNLGRPQDEQHAFTIDLHGYRARRQEALMSLALHAVEQARLQGVYEIQHPLSSAERRQIHNMLKEYEDLETFSRGKEPARHLVVQRCEGRSHNEGT